MRFTVRGLPSLLVSVLALVGCGAASNSPTNGHTHADEPLGWFGTFERDNQATPVPAGGGIVRLVLKMDGRYHMDEAVVCVTAPCLPRGQDGTYTIGDQGVSLLRDGAQQPQVLVIGQDLYGDYGPTSSSLLILDEEGDVTAVLAPAEHFWCRQLDDCVQQGLAPQAEDGEELFCIPRPANPVGNLGAQGEAICVYGFAEGQGP
jgi:hypothetical protein